MLDTSHLHRNTGVLALVLSLCSACLGDLHEDQPDVDAAPAALTSLTASFATALTGQYLSAQDGGGTGITADRGAALGWETFTLLDRNDGELVSGDLVYVRTSGGRFLMAENGGGAALSAASANQLDWETFRVVRQAGAGVVRSGDVIGLQALVSGRFVRAVNGGGSGVDVQGAALSTWESFRIGLGSTPGRRLVWSDEFDGNAVDEAKWAYEVQRPRWVNNELQNYTYRRRENARVENGTLVIEGRRDWFEGHEYSSARLKTQGKASWTYGRVEARLQVPGGWGTWPAFWMMPDNFSRGWPACGEIDIMEHVGHDANVVHATTHSLAHNWQRPEQRTAHTSVPGATSGFQTYALEWSSERIDMFVDGVHYFSSTNDHRGDDSWPFDKNFYVILNLAIGGDWGGARGVDPNVWPQRLVVDYVRVYQ